MPKIRLKPNSPEFADSDEKPQDSVHLCDMPACSKAGLYKAPKTREGGSYYYFCLEHVSAYNEAWNYFAGMSEAEIQAHMMKSLQGDRPTWRYGVHAESFKQYEERLRRTRAFFAEEEDDLGSKDSHKRENAQAHGSNAGYDSMAWARGSPEHEAMAVMGLRPPLTLAQIKARYKELVKRYHPDVKGGQTDSEDLLKSVNMAYTILKLAYARHQTYVDTE